MTTRSRATIADLYHTPDGAKAEIVNGQLVLMSPVGDWPNRAAGAIYISLRQYERTMKGGRAYTDNVGYRVRLSNRDSLSPDVSFYTGPSMGMKFLEGAPVFAVEVRSEGGYGAAVEEAIASKRADYFAAGTLVVWDLDLLSADVVRVYRAADPEHPSVYRRGEVAEAEPAVPGWRIAVDDMFD